MGTPELIVPSAAGTFEAARLEHVFNACFANSLHTRLVGGADEPLYQPASVAGEFHALFYRSDYFASALHEVAHWCIAGEQRRQQVDFGYWYAPDGRTAAQQRKFETVEYKPQALEWYFARACAYPFRVSVDNLDPAQGSLPDTGAFCRRVADQACHWQQEGLPARAAIFFRALCIEFGTSHAPDLLEFTAVDLQ